MSHRGHCPACLLEEALAPQCDAIPPLPQQSSACITIQLPLGHTAASSVFLVRVQGTISRVLRLKTWRKPAPPDFMPRFQRLQHELSDWNDASVPGLVSAWVDETRHAWVLSEFSQGMPIIERIRSGRVDPTRAEVCVGTLSAAIRAGHRRGLVHGSIGPGNLIVTAGCRTASWLDFGQVGLLVQDGSPPTPAADIAALDALRAAIRQLTSSRVPL